MASLRDTVREYQDDLGTVKYYAQIHLQFWQNSVCTGQRRLAIRKCIKSERVMNGGSV